MAIDLKFTKFDNATPWGFRLVGGVDFEQPLVVVKVIENSIADKAGLCVGDIIVRVNDTSTAGLTHADAHDLIHTAGIDFTFGVRRGAFTDILVPCEDEDNSEEIEVILNEAVIDKQKYNINQKSHMAIDKPSQKVQESSAQKFKSSVLENLAGQEKVLMVKEGGSERKWSTFLQKPRQPIPQCKKREEERKILGAPYTVKIVRQPKKSPEERKVKFQPTVTEAEYTCDQTTEESVKTTTEHQLHNGCELEVEISATEIEETEIAVSDMYDSEDNVMETEETEKIAEIEGEGSDTLLLKKQEIHIIQTKPLDIELESVKESSLSLEEQLAAVQKQLLALSQLPSAIQVTLEAVTEQLNQIVQAKIRGSGEENVEYDAEMDQDDGRNEEGEDGPNGEDSSSERAEVDITENDNDNIISDSEMREDDSEENMEKNDLETIQEEERSQEEREPELTEEEREAKIREEEAKIREEEANIREQEAKIKEEELRAKKQKEMEEEQRKRDWVARPICLPGGRKWTDPDDAVPKLKTPKMSDEKICSTIDAFSEVIVGKTKGESNCFLVPSKFGAKKRINFLKFEPPAKNLDYLQRSEVYRMIHDMEPPVSGIGTRAEKILPEEDYYTDKGAP